ncbi:MAG: glycosyltransferase 87 family protein [Gordonia sp. (in: high G+C Gram-positive bacteria)]|uniref:glycosyltransferase 87 family protein n=1 Tax=Gordonia sp. (in: high G+C Gram-positive bacteria) TaxID=84139 RepID=UPI0039E58052
MRSSTVVPGDPPRRTIPGPVLGVLGALALAALIWQLAFWPFWEVYGIWGNGVDARVYRGGGRAVLGHGPLYDGPVYKIWQFTYTPFAAILMVPLGLIGSVAAVVVVKSISVVCLILLVAMTLRALGFRRDGRFWFATASASLAATLLEPVRTTLWNGQINLIIAVLVVGCLTLPLGRWRGIGVGLAAGIKLTPLFFCCHLVATRQWRAVAVAVATFAGTILVGLAVLRGQAWEYWTATLQDTSRIGPVDAVANQSLNGFLVRLGVLGLWHAPGWLWLPVGTALALLALYAVWRAHRAGATMLAVTLAGLTSCAVAPFSWGHHWVWMVPLFLIVLVRASDAVQRARPRTWFTWLVATGVFVAAVVWPSLRTEPSGVTWWQFGLFRLLWHPDPRGWEWAGSLFASADYLIVFLTTLAVTLWWTRGADPIRFNANAVTVAETAR